MTMENENLFQKFRRMLIQDENFRARFAENPADTLRSVGIDIPRDVTLPKIDKDDLDARVEALQSEYGEDTEAALFAGTAARVKPITNARLDNIVIPNLKGRGDIRDIGTVRRPGGTVYTISVCGTADW
jgi:hypothetical protein